jgi:hypothetical protein
MFCEKQPKGDINKRVYEYITIINWEDVHCPKRDQDILSEI